MIGLVRPSPAAWRLLFCLAAVTGLSPCLGASGARAELLRIDAEPVPFDSTDPGRFRAGPLVWRGGLALSSPDARFGGLSDLVVSADGTRLRAVGDKGIWVDATLTYDVEGRLAGIRDGSIGRLLHHTGRPIDTHRNEDAEALAELPDGSVLVGFEVNHRIWRYPPGDLPLAGVPVPMPLIRNIRDDVGPNSGIEGLAVLTDGSLLALTEGSLEEPGTAAYLWRDGRWAKRRYLRFGSFRPTGAARLPDGDVLVLERSYSLLDGVAIRLARLPAQPLARDDPLTAREIATLKPPLSIDNVEGVSVRQGSSGETLVYLISDDNFNPLQRTLLLLFALEE